ncbi:MAG: DMT family transporter, partial [Oricola sp.]
LMPISNASAILQVSPLFVTLGAGLFLGESVGWRRWMAIAAGFVGVIMVVRPGMEGFNAASLLAIAGAVGFAVRDIGTRAAPQSIPTSIIALVANILMLFASIALQFWLGPWKAMSGHVVMLVAAASVFGVAGMHSVTMALRLGEVSVVAPFRYVRVVAAMVIGILVFAERPDIFATAGSLLIVASGIYTLYREQKSRQGRQHGS